MMIIAWAEIQENREKNNKLLLPSRIVGVFTEEVTPDLAVEGWTRFCVVRRYVNRELQTSERPHFPAIPKEPTEPVFRDSRIWGRMLMLKQQTTEILKLD